jgi:hypothetical protein
MSAIAVTRSARVRPLVAYALTLIVVAAGVCTAWYRTTYNVWPLQRASSRVHWCDRDYESAGGHAQTWPEISATSGYPVRAVGRYPPLAWPGQQLFAPAVPGARPGACGTAVYLRTGPDAYRAYTLLGGP